MPDRLTVAVPLRHNDGGECVSDMATHHDIKDADLVRDLGLRCERSIETLYNRHADPVMRLAMRVTGDRHRAEEALQDVFCLLWRSSEKFSPDRGSLRTWLLTIGHHRSVDIVRRERRLIPSDLEVTLAETPSEDAPVDDVVCGHVSDAATRAAILRLPAKLREPIVLSYFQGLTQSQIAARNDIPLGTVKSRIRQGQQALRDALSDR